MCAPKQDRFVLMLEGVKCAMILRKPRIEYGVDRDYTRDDFENEIAWHADAQILARLPTRFTTFAEHPRSTNLLCWHCALQFDGVPYFIPITSTRISDAALEWTIDGNFCSWACATAYINNHTRDPSKKWELLANIANIRACATPIEPAPPRTIMRTYCGEGGMSVRDYIRKVRGASERALAE